MWDNTRRYQKENMESNKMDGKQAAIVVRDMFDAVRVVPPTFQLGDMHLDRGIWTITSIVDGQTYNVQIGEYSGCIMCITKVKPSSMDKRCLLNWRTHNADPLKQCETENLRTANVRG